MKDLKTIREQLLVPGNSVKNYTEECPLFDQRFLQMSSKSRFEALYLPEEERREAVRVDLYLFLEMYGGCIHFGENSITRHAEITGKLVELFPQLSDDHSQHMTADKIRLAYKRRLMKTFLMASELESGQVQRRLDVVEAIREGRKPEGIPSFIADVRRQHRELNYWYFGMTPSVQNQRYFEPLPVSQGRYQRKPDVYAGIAAALAEKRSPTAIAKEFGVSRSYVYKVKQEMDT